VSGWKGSIKTCVKETGFICLWIETGGWVCGYGDEPWGYTDEGFFDQLYQDVSYL
jgi:hypothetical protein